MSGKLTHECYETLVKAYEYFNQTLFKSQLPDVIISFHRQRKIMGYASIGRWVNQKKQYVDELAVNPEYFAKHPLIEVFQTLCHEMVHIWQAHNGSPGRRGYHNIQWTRKMASIGLIPSSTGKPGGQKTGEHMMDYVLFEGKFHLACRELISSGYRINWVDRFPVFRLEIPVFAYDDEGHAVELNNKLNAKSSKTLAKNVVMETEDLSYTAEFEQYARVQDPGYDDDFGIPQHSKPRPRSGRVKYTCKSCQVQIWGKRNLNLLCGDCNMPLKEIE